MTQFVGDDHAGKKVTYRSHSGIPIYMNISPIRWYSKKQNNFELNTFGLEIIALWTVLEIKKGLCCNIMIMRVPIDEPTLVLCNNKLVLTSTMVP